jgi:D-alanyl-D-alanine-carboxypeptidase/D-alanyl-D-alanine-endopeptidase
MKVGYSGRVHSGLVAKRTPWRSIGASAIALFILERGISPQSVRTDDVIRDVLAPRVLAGLSSGIVVGIVDHGTSKFMAYGTFDGPGTPVVDERTVFEIGSVTKMFTGTVLADMVLKGEVGLEDAVAQYLPATVHVPARGGKSITLLDLATHRSGLPSLPENLHPANHANPFADYTVGQLYGFLSAYALAHDPGELYGYSNLGMALLGHALARRAGVSYEALVVRRVLEPLQMRDTHITLPSALRSRFATGHDAYLDRQRPWELPTLAASGGLRSTAHDLILFLRACLYPDETPLERQTLLASEPRRAGDRPSVQVGLGWHIVERDGERVATANGQTGGFAAFLAYNTARDRGVVILSNSARSVEDIGWYVLNLSTPVPVSRPLNRRKEVAPDPSTFERFVGQYRLSPTESITVSKKGRALWARITGLEYELFAYAPAEFFLKAVDAQLTFVVDSARSHANSVIVRYDGQEFTAHRVP